MKQVSIELLCAVPVPLTYPRTSPFLNGTSNAPSPRETCVSLGPETSTHTLV